jgi:predicted adenylyl cyclase CyaB
MPRNIEIKARIDCYHNVARLAAALADQGPIEIAQDDTFFVCAAGRLKLRVFSNGTGELIFYRRADQAGPKESFYVRSPTEHPESLRQALTIAYGSAGRVIKDRTLFLAGRTRIHLDRVQGLGDFLELEVVLKNDESAAVGHGEAEALLVQLGITRQQLIAGAYVDLLSATSGQLVNPAS